MTPLVSVIMPVYNGEKYLGEAIEDILSQSYKDFELIVVDDGSIDRSVEIVQSYLEDDKRIKLLRKENGGTGSALNLGFEIAKGKYGVWAAADDKKYTNFLDTLVGILEKGGNCKFAFSAFDEFADSDFDKRMYRKLFPNTEVGILKEFLDISAHYCITGVCFMFDLQLKKICGQYELIPGEDYIMGVKMGAMTDVWVTPEPLGAHRLHKDCLTVLDPACVRGANEKVKDLITGIRNL